jgi:hypothetical protein
VNRAVHSSRGVLLSTVGVFECDREALTARRPWPIRGSTALGKRNEQSLGPYQFVVPRRTEGGV